MKKIINVQVGGMVFLIGVSLALWLLVLEPLMQIPEARDSEAENIRTQISEIEADTLNLSTIARDYGEESSTAQELNSKIPQALERFQFQQQLQGLLTDNGLSAQNLRISGGESLSVVDTEPFGGQGVYQSSVTLHLGADSPGSLVEVANDLHTFERTLDIGSVSIDRGAATQDSTEELSTRYVLTVTGTIYSAPQIDTTPPPAPVTSGDDSSADEGVSGKE